MKKNYLLIQSFLFLFLLGMIGNNGYAQSREIISANFESGEITELDFVNDATYPWEIASDGANGSAYCIKSTNAGVSSSTSAISLEVTFGEDGNIAFYANCQGEGSSSAWDKCIFYIDDVVMFSYGAWVTGWQGYAFDVTLGTHTFKWAYTKDSSINPTGDCMMIDDIVITGVGEVSCPKPTDVVFSNITGREADMAWTPLGDETMWLVAVAESNTDWSNANISDLNPVLVTGTPQHHFSGLTSETEYAAVVVAVCNIQNEEYSDPKIALFTTGVSCGKPMAFAATADAHNAELSWAAPGSLYFFDFEDGTLQGWTTLDANDDGYNFEAVTSSAAGHNGSNGYAMSASYIAGAGGLTPDNYLVSPMMCQIDANSSVNFFYNFYSTYWPDKFGIAISTAETPTADDFETIWESESKIARTANNGDKQLEKTRAGEWTEQIVSLADYAGQQIWIAFRHFDCNNQYQVWFDDITLNVIQEEIEIPFFNLRYRIEGTEEWQYVNNINDLSHTLTGLDAETTYEVGIQTACGDEDGESAWVSTTFTTDIACPAPTNLQVTTTTYSADITWQGNAGEYNLCYRPVDPSEVATITLTAGDVWSDGSGYQMLLDADATAYGTIIPETGGLTSGGDATSDVYAQFEYKIPENADGSMTTQNIVLNNSITIDVPAGVYDWCITNPTPGDRIWIASDNGNIPGRYDDFEFEAGATYEFVVTLSGNNDAVNLTTTRRANNREYEWICVDGITTNNYTIEGLDPNTKYQVRVQAVCGGEDGESTFIGTTFTTDVSCPAPTNVTVTDITQESAQVAWNADADSYIVRYRTAAGVDGYAEDFEGGAIPSGWDIIDNDGDGFNWTYSGELSAHSGSGIVYSQSYDNSTSAALTPDNWLISPVVELEGKTLSFWYVGQDPSYPSEVFAVYLSTDEGTDINSFTKISDDITATGTYQQFSMELTDYTGTGRIAIRHYNISDQFILNIDDFQVATEITEGEWIEVEVSGSPVTLQPLAPGTTYEVQVMSVCGDDDSSDWSQPVIFTTEGTEAVNEIAENNITVWNRNGEIRIEMPNDANFNMTVTNILGQIVMTSNVKGAGSHIVKHNLTNGIYVVTLTNAETNLSAKIVVR